MRILVTGATGFVGSHLVELLAASHHVRVLVRDSSDLRYLRDLEVERAPGDLHRASALRKAAEGPEVVLHLAALTRGISEVELREVNAGGTRRLLEAAAAGGTVRRFLYVSSMAAVGPSRDGRPVAPEDEPRPLTAYGRSKLAGEEACHAFRDRVQVVILRPPAVYGPRDQDLLTFFKLAAWGLLPVPRGPARPLQMIHVADLVRGIAAATPPGSPTGVFHLANPQAYTWVETLDLMAAAIGKPGRRVPIPEGLLKVAGAANGALGRWVGRPQIFDRDKVRELLAPGWLSDTEAMRRAFSFESSIPLEEGFRETAAWYRKEGWLR